MGDITVKEIFDKLWNFGLPIVMFAIWFYSGYKGVWIWRRELDSSIVTSNEWKAIALRSLGYAETNSTLAQRVLEKQ